jgi:hypothetical protein
MAGLRLLKISLCCALIGLCASIGAWAAEYHGQVFFGGVPVPGATVTVTQGDKKSSTVTDRQGLYEFADLADGQWKIEIEMSGFSKLDDTVTVAPDAPQGKWDLKLMGLDQILAEAQVSTPLKTRPENAVQAKPGEEKPKAAEQNVPEVPPMPADQAAEKSADGMLINGSENNASTSQYSLSPAFGNRKPGKKGLFHGGMSRIEDKSALNTMQILLTRVLVRQDL